MIEQCRFPVICGVDGSCIGGAIDLISACDIVYCTDRAKFAIKEIDIAIIADLGTLNRLPILTSNWGLMKELAFTGREFDGVTAKQLGIVSRQFPTAEEMKVEIDKVAATIASKSPVAILGTKKTMNFVRNKQIEQGLEFVRHWNMS